MKKRISLDSVIDSCSKIVCGSLLAGSLVAGISSAKAQPYQTLEDSLKKLWETPAEINPIDPWDHYCDSTIREDMNIPLYNYYDELIPLTDEEGYVVAYFRIYAGFRNPDEQNLDLFMGYVGTGQSSKGNLKILDMGITRLVVIYHQGVYPERAESWDKEQTSFGQRLRDDSLKKSNLKGNYQKKLVKWDLDIEKRFLSSSSELLHIAKTALNVPLDALNFFTMEELPGQLETDYGSMYREPIIAEEIYLNPQLGNFDSYGSKDIHVRLNWNSTKKRRPSKLYIQTNLRISPFYVGPFKYINFGLEEGNIVRTLNIPQRTEEE